MKLFSLDNILSPPPSPISPIHSGRRIDVDLSLGEPRRDVHPHSWYKQLAGIEGINFYYPSEGDPELISLIRRVKYPERAFDDLCITVVNGAIHGLDLIFRTHLVPGDEVLLPDPGFPPYRELVHFSGGVPRYYPMTLGKGAFCDIAALESAITDRTKFVLINSPHNPTGKTLTSADIQSLSGLMAKYPGLKFISDEVYQSMVFDQKPFHSLAASTTNGFVVNSLSKSHSLQGMRIGWIMAPHTLMQSLNPYLQNAIGCVSSVGQELAKIALANSRFMPRFEEARDLASEILDYYGVSYIKPEGGFFIMVKVGDDCGMSRQLQAAGIKVIPGSVFGQRGAGHVRVSFCQSNQFIRDAYTRLGKYLTRKGID
jgi:aspartate/methionine/tyrosine aminotransferase